MKRLSIVLVLVLMMGCATLPPQGDTSKAAYIGDYYTSNLNEIMVSVPTGDKDNQYNNLHLIFSALINPKEITIGTSYDVSRIVQRFNDRLSSIIVQDILTYEKITVKDLPTLRDKLVKKAQTEFNQTFSKWTNAEKFNVKIVLTSIFLTDGSVASAKRSYRW